MASLNHTVIVPLVGMWGKEKVTHIVIMLENQWPWNGFYRILLIKTFALLERIL